MIQSTSISSSLSFNHSNDNDISRNDLVRLIQNLEKTKDVSKRLEKYDAILGNKKIDCLLSKEEIADVFWNQALDGSTIAERYFNGEVFGRRQLVPALTHQQSAISAMEKAKSLYGKAEYIEMAEENVKKMRIFLEHIRLELVKASAKIPDFVLNSENQQK